MSNDTRIPKITSLKQFTMQMAMVLLGIHPVANKNIVCPFPDHNDHDPSCSIKKWKFQCYGQGCQKRGDAIEFVRLVKGFVTRQEAKKWTCKEIGIPSGDPERDKKDDAVDEKIQNLGVCWGWSKGAKDLRELEARETEGTLDEAGKKNLRLFRKVFGYLKERGFDLDFCEKHEIRYSPPRSFRRMLEGKPEQERLEMTNAFKSVGLLSTNSNLLLSNRIVFPLFFHGRLVNLTGRTWQVDDIRAKSTKYIFPANSKPKLPESLFNLDECADLSSVYMVEGPIDALTLIQHGITNVVAVCGTNGLSKGKIRALKRTKNRTVTVVLDTDPNEAGQNGAMKAGKLLFENGFTPRVKSLPFRNGKEKQDVNSFFLDGGTVEQFNAIPTRDWFELTLDAIHVDPADPPVQRTAALKHVYDLIGRLPHSAHEHYQGVILAKFPGLKKTEIVENVKQAHRRHNESERLSAYAIKQLVCARERVIADTGGTVYRYTAGVYVPWPEQEIASRIIDIRKRASDDRDPSSFEIREVLTFLRAENHVPQERFNPRGYLNTKNRLINLETGQSEDHNPEFISTIQLGFDADPDAKCPLWLETIAEILPHEADRRLLQMMFGYSLTSDVRHHVAFLLYGDGENGKSLVLRVLNALLSDANCSHLFVSDLKDKFRLAQLYHKLVNITGEVESSGLIEDAKFKSLVDGTVLTVERKYHDPFDFGPYAKWWIATNNLPKTRDFSRGYWRRWIILPFRQEFNGARVDKSRFEKIVPAELPGILRWAMVGLHALRQAGGFPQTDSTRAALLEYQTDVDPVRQFIEAEIKMDGTEKLAFSVLYANFSQWCACNGVKTLSSRAFGKRFLSVTKLETRDSNGTRWYFGIRFRHDADNARADTNDSDTDFPFGALEPRKVIPMDNYAK